LHYNGDSAIGCGAFIEIEYKGKKILAHVIDECPYPVSDSSLGCWNTEHLDLSKAAFSSLEDLNTGIIDIKWKIVPSELVGPIEYHYHDSASQWWMALQVRNHCQAVKKLEMKINGNWQSLTRAPWNYFTFDGDAGSPPYSFRVTSIEGEILEDNDLNFGGGQTIKGAKNFNVTEIDHKPYDFKMNACAKKSISTFTTIDNTLYLDKNFLKEIDRVEVFSVHGRKVSSCKPAEQLSFAKSSGIKIIKLYYRN
jgi:expansin (peptidoglycan-binding protein)